MPVEDPGFVVGECGGPGTHRGKQFQCSDELGGGDLESVLEELVQLRVWLHDTHHL